MQPHFPTLDGETGNIIDLDNFVSGDISPFEDLRSGVDDRPYWEAYRRNLKRVLDDVTLLLQNVQAERVLLTADHGNAWGEDGLWGHPPQPAHPAIRRVPWVVTTADDIGGYEPPTSADTSAVNATVQERLTALGYDE